MHTMHSCVLTVASLTWFQAFPASDLVGVLIYSAWEENIEKLGKAWCLLQSLEYVDRLSLVHALKAQLELLRTSFHLRTSNLSEGACQVPSNIICTHMYTCMRHLYR